MSRYICLQCGREYSPDPFRLECDECREQALLEARYAMPHGSTAEPDQQRAWSELGFDAEDQSFFRYQNWLPVRNTFSGAALPALCQSRAFARKLGLKDLDLLFSGYSPELGCDIRSTTFKEFEAYSVLANLGGSLNRGTGQTTGQSESPVLVVASAGNTARAFAEVALRENLAVLLVVPQPALKELRLSVPYSKDSQVVFVASTNKHEPSEYAEAIAISRVFCRSPHFFPEGGVKNVARRDGLGVGYLHAQFCRAQQKAPPYRYYFQAIGSGTGAIGSYSMYRRLKQAGCIDQNHQLSLMLAQNAPFIPVVEHWRKNCRSFTPYEAQESLRRNRQLAAPVLANRNPPYAVVGGLADLLRESGGMAFGIDNREIAQMQEFFAAEEGLDILPSAAAAAAALRCAAEHGQIDKDAPILLHLTGGGQSQFQSDFPQSRPVEPALTADWQDLENSLEQQRQLISTVEALFGF